MKGALQIVAKFGMMHIIATNACIVIRTLVKESSKEMMGHHQQLGQNGTQNQTQWEIWIYIV